MQTDPPRHAPSANAGAGRLRILRPAGYRAMPWKNGGGITHEIARVTDAGDVFDWRLSMARIDRSGPFSDFSGYRRILLLLEGAGFVLRSAGLPDRVFRSQGDAQVFDGALPVHCDLVGGSCTDLNLMVRNSIPAPFRIEPIRAPLPLHARGTLILFALQGAGRVLADGQTADLAARDTLIARTGCDIVVQTIPGGGAPVTFFIADVG